MKNIIYLTTLFFVFNLLSCETPVIFTEHQPQGYQAQPSFFSYYKGSYFSELDSSLIIISDNVFCKERLYDIAMPMSVLDTMEGVELKNGSIKLEGEKEWFPTTIIDDIVHTQITKRDTLFEIGKDQVLTMFRGHQILNNKRDDKNWEIAILSLDVQMNLAISIATEPKDLERLQQITAVKDLSKGDTVQYLITPTVREFNRILKEELVFEKLEYCVRITDLIEM